MIALSPKVTYVPMNWTTIVFWLLLFGQMVSTPCYLFMFYHLFGRKVLRKTFQNHAIIILLSFNFIQLMIDLSLTLDFLRVGYISPLIPACCVFHAFINYGIGYGAIFLMLWISIERHIHIFHSVLVATTRGRLLFHYIPLTIFSLYAPILYFYLIVLCPCERVHDPLKYLCGVVCFRNIVPDWFNWFESLANNVIPILLIAVFGISLILRVIVQKRRLQQAAGWRRHRKMIIQLVWISALYLVFDFPYVIITILQWAGSSTVTINAWLQYAAYFTYVPAIVLPYATVMTLPEVRQKLRALIICKVKQRAIVPLIQGT